jgi:hypothetical protein
MPRAAAAQPPPGILVWVHGGPTGLSMDTFALHIQVQYGREGKGPAVT